MGKSGALALGLFTLLAIFGRSEVAHAQETAFGHIVSLQTGSLGGAPGLGVPVHHRIVADDTVSVVLDVPFVNSADFPIGSPLTAPGTPCRITTAGYALDPADPGGKLNESVLLSAFLGGKRVRLTLDGCVFEKPRIISVTLSTAAQ